MSTTLTKFSTQLADLIASAAPSVVRVEARRRLPASGIAWSEDGLVISANHVVEHDEGIRIGLADGSAAAADVLGRDPVIDLVVLRIDEVKLRSAEWVGIDALHVGNLVFALGRPHNSIQASAGVLSGIGPAWRTHAGGVIDAFIRPDITMYPGFSGGPLITAEGAFAGMNTSALTHSGNATIPEETLRKSVEAIIAHGRVPRGFLGVGIQPVRIAPALAEAVDAETGLMVMSVEEGSPAESAGIRQGDIIFALDGDPIRSVGDLRAALYGVDRSRPAKIRIIRSNEDLELEVDIEMR